MRRSKPAHCLLGPVTTHLLDLQTGSTTVLSTNLAIYPEYLAELAAGQVPQEKSV